MILPSRKGDLREESGKGSMEGVDDATPAPEETVTDNIIVLPGTGVV